MKATSWKPTGMVLTLGLFLSTTGCGTLMNLSGISTIRTPKVRAASVMGGVQTDDYLIESPDPSLAAPPDLLFSLAADVTLLPVTLTIAAIVGDGPFAPESQPPSPERKASEGDAPQRREGKRTR